MHTLRLAMSLALVFGAASSTASAQSLADLAQREEARRKAIKAPAKVITNEDLPSVPAPPSPPVVVDPASQPVQATPATGAAPAADAAAAATAPAGDAQAAPAAVEVVKDEAYWRRRISVARDNLARSQIFQEALQSRINALSADFVNRDDPAQRAVVAADRQKALAEMERVQRDIVQAEKDIADTQEAARKEGIPAGWVR
jgi:hypothetical protein